MSIDQIRASLKELDQSIQAVKAKHLRIQVKKEQLIQRVKDAEAELKEAGVTVDLRSLKEEQLKSEIDRLAKRVKEVGASLALAETVS